MGGDKKSKLPPEMKKSILQHVDTDCTKSLKKLKEWVQNEYMIEAKSTGQFESTTILRRT